MIRPSLAMILSSVYQPWPADHLGPGRNSPATKAVSYVMAGDMILTWNRLRKVTRLLSLCRLNKIGSVERLQGNAYSRHF